MRTADQGSATNRTVDFSYDRVYNRTGWSDTLYGGSLTYHNNAVNQYTQVGNNTPTYDARGNITGGWGGIWNLVYDCENRLVSAGGYISYGYDLLGRRISRTAFYDTTVYVWDGAHIIAEYTNGSLTKKYIYGPGIDRPVAMVNVSGQTETWYYYYADALGSIRLISDASGAIVESYAYDVYGWPRVMTSAGADGNWLTEDVSPYNFVSAIGNPYMFTARRWDHHTFLYYYRHRDYSPDLGRFLQTDPLLYIDGMNLYAYCGNNPINRIDPMGKAWSWPATGIGAVGGAASGFGYGIVTEGISALRGDGFSWGNIVQRTGTGAAAGAIGGAVVGACFGDPSAAVAIAAGGITSGAANAVMDDFIDWWGNRPGPSYPPADPSDITVVFPPSPFPPNGDSGGEKGC